ncbi:DEAD/DEAH box helicase [Kribbia dieselivorans]|uniref:DEAD/DEAH box helicase n=1 Tax=Kribbia dieselivorans TaxID=331526 RepID=UPI0008380298|nr:DEAD/DEAH box helicase [Kribbia dieselivorans]
MSELLPSVQAPEIQESLLDYLATTFSLADEDARASLLDFLSNPEKGIFKGPYLRLRLPFQPAKDGWRDSLEWYDGFTPYGHQAAAFERLTSLGRDGSRPLPTLVTTGTGSGKTEAFLYPILDHVLRARRRGVSGMKALILYPMNALANDQASRLANLLTSQPDLQGVTAALYTGEQGPQRTVVTQEGLITQRGVIRSDPPDILLTNYKMLDQLLLREEDQRIWAASATSLQYLVVDEFHTYDGAQGTDVSMLLRRLGLALKSHWPAGDTFTAADRARPLGIITPVGTSATLGDKGDPAAMLAFARTVFGEEFGDDAVITESRLSAEEWIAGAHSPFEPHLNREAIDSVINVAGGESSGRRIAELVLSGIVRDHEGRHPDLGAATADELLTLVKALPLTATLIEAASPAASLADIAPRVLPAVTIDAKGQAAAEQFLLLFAAALSHIRKEVGRSALSVDLHLWVRELTRIDRVAASTPHYQWSDDVHLTGHGTATETSAGEAYPAMYCRHCGRSGWSVVRAPIGGFDLQGADAQQIRTARVMGNEDFRVLIHAPVEAEAEAENEADAATLQDPDDPRLLWFNVGERRVLSQRPNADDEDLASGRILPVLAHAGPNAGRLSESDVCPSCLKKDGIRFLGSAIATLLSVSLSTMFGSDDLDQAEKKALVFTDSVQDAAHRAGFVQSRSHSLTLRAVLRAAVGDEPVSLDRLVERVIRQAGADPHRRYRILPPEFADRAEFTAFWQNPERSKRRVERRVRRRLLFDAVLEFGLQSRLGRTLELTGTLAAEVDVEPSVMLKAAAEAERICGIEHLAGTGITDVQRAGWVRGVLERMRTEGAIEHEWFRKYQQEDGRRYSIWGGRPRSDGMPAFPRGRSAPGYPRIGGGSGQRESDLVPVAGARSWYAVWTAQTLGLTAQEGASLAVALLKHLASVEVITAVNTNSGGQVFEIPQEAVLVGQVDDDAYARGRNLLACDTCGSLVPGSARVVDELDGFPCFVVRCHGRLARLAGQAGNFYRRLYGATDVTRVVAREHTSLLDDETRLLYENQFRASATDPQAPNVLVATPTLEMGIDIGDLSTVILASLPRSVASYLQRVGRAGRLTGSALNLAFVSGRGEQLPRLGDPLSVINGQVRPPATYIDAEEILRRQYLASISDRLARQGDAPHPHTPKQAMGSVDEGSYLRALITGAEEAANLEEFLSAFADLGEGARSRLKQWSTVTGGPATSDLSVYVHEQSHRWTHQVESLQHHIKEIQERVPELQEHAALPAASTEDQLALRTAKAALKLARQQVSDLTGVEAYWIGVLEEYGLLPNYTLLDDSVELDVTLSWIDPDTQEYQSEPASFSRRAALALREFAPGATFYARGYKVVIDAVDLGSDAEAIHRWTLCPSCGFSRDLVDGAAPMTCPRCGDAGIADVRQTLEVVELERVSSAMRREEAAIDDGRDERERVTFQVVTTADIGEPRQQWYIEDYQFGVKHLPRMTIRWLNLGRVTDQGSGSTMIAGDEYSAPLFRVCAACGALDSRTGQNNPAEHRPWCRYRKATEENVRSIALSRTLVTEGLVVRLPPVLSYGDHFAIPSLMAAIRVGLHEYLGGAPDHLAIEQIVDPHLSDGSENADALLLHDTVPGGTGYLAELADPERFYALLHQAWEVVRDCPCQDEGRMACHRCLTPFINSANQRRVARVSAEASLRAILTGGQEGEPASGMAWKVTDTTTPYDPETHIEQRFRRVLRERLEKGLGASVLEHPSAHGTRWTINPGAGRTWSMEPQLALGGVQPDFVFTSSDPAVPRIAVFCDGWKFHASPAINNIAADADKRQSLRDHDFVVIAVTWQDLEDAEAGTVTPPIWFSDKQWTRVMSATRALKPGMVDLVRGGPIDHLTAWISNPDKDATSALAEALPLLLLGQGARGRSDGSRSLVACAKEFADTNRVPEEGDRSLWTWRSDTLTVVARNAHENGEATEIAVVLDDRPDQLGQEHRQAWQDWLRLSNLLNLRLQNAYITAYSLADSARITSAAEPTALPEPWESLRNEATGDEQELLVDLAHAQIAVPVLGFETADGIPIDLAWPDQRVAVPLSLDEGAKLELVAEGWRLVEADVPAISAALAAEGEQ